MSDKFTNGVLAGSTDVSIPVVIRTAADSTETTGKAYTDITSASYWRQGGTRTAITPATQTVNGAHSDGGFVEVDATNQPGLYRFDLPDAAVATGADWVVVSIVIASSFVYHERFDLTSASIVSGYRTIRATVDTVTNTHTPTVTEFQADDVTEATKNHYVGRLVRFTSGNLIGQERPIVGYSQVGGIGQFTVLELTEAPANNDTFDIV